MRVLSFEDLKERKGINFSRAHIWRLEREGKFPKRIKLGQSRTAWADNEIDEWLRARMAERAA